LTDRSRLDEEELAALMVAYQGGELSAFEGVYERLAPALRQYLRSLTFDAAAAEDLLQEAFLQIHRSRRTYRAPHPVAPWAFSIARNVYRMDRRSAGRRRRHEVPAEETAPEIPVPAAAEGLAGRLEVRRALGCLPAERREALLLHHVWGFSFGEIGGLLGIRGGAAKVRAHRALAALRSLLGATPDGFQERAQEGPQDE
jgi:RNA polymerase sigma-70 factor (ECF subfamily)